MYFYKTLPELGFKNTKNNGFAGSMIIPWLKIQGPKMFVIQFKT